MSVRELPGKYSRRATNAQQIVVGNLAYSVSKQRPGGAVFKGGSGAKRRAITDKFSGQSRGFGFVEMANAEDTFRAIKQFNDTELKGRNIKVNEAKPRESSFAGDSRSGGDNRDRNRC